MEDGNLITASNENISVIFDVSVSLTSDTQITTTIDGAGGNPKTKAFELKNKTEAFDTVHLFEISGGTFNVGDKITSDNLKKSTFSTTLATSERGAKQLLPIIKNGSASISTISSNELTYT